MYYIVLRKCRSADDPFVSEVVRNAYISNVNNSWLNALFNEITFQAIVVISAFMFIAMGIPLFYCLLSIPIVLIALYLLIYGSFVMKSTEIMYTKRPLESWLAEAYEPPFFDHNPQNCTYLVLTEREVEKEGLDLKQFRKKVIGTIAVQKHSLREDWAWLFRLAVDKRYRRKGVGLKLISQVKMWCAKEHYNNLELAMSECQEGARQLFNDAGFTIKQLYHKTIFTGAFTLQMFQLRCEVRATF